MMGILTKFEEQNFAEDPNGSPDNEDGLSQLEGVDLGLYLVLSYVTYPERDVCQIRLMPKNFGHGYLLDSVQLSKKGYVILKAPFRSNC